MAILVCEDDKEIVDIMTLLLHDMDFEVLTAYDVHEFRAILAKHVPDLVILDYWLKDQKADKLIHEFKQTHSDETPIVLISAVNNIDHIGQKLGVTAVLPKPFDINVFQNLIQKLLAEHEK